MLPKKASVARKPFLLYNSAYEKVLMHNYTFYNHIVSFGMRRGSVCCSYAFTGRFTVSYSVLVCGSVI